MYLPILSSQSLRYIVLKIILCFSFVCLCEFVLQYFAAVWNSTNIDMVKKITVFNLVNNYKENGKTHYI